MPQKRERSTNFSREEIDILIKLVEQNKSVIENKKSDAITWGEKERCWKSIEINFNCTSGVTYRSAKTLRLKYEGIKRDIRKKFALRSERYETRGALSSAPALTPSEVKVKEMILLSVDGMDSNFDTDHISNTADVTTCPSVKSEEIQSVENSNLKDIPVHPLKRSLCDQLEGNNKKLSQWKPTSLRSKKHSALSIQKPQKPFEKVAESKLKLIQLQKNVLEEELINNRKKWSFEEKEREQRQKEWEEQKKRWSFEEEERQHKRETWDLEKKTMLKKLNE